MDFLKLAIERFWHYKILFGIIVVLGLILIALSTFFLATTKQNGQTPVDVKKLSDIETLARQLDIPWSLDFLPDGDLIFTERPGNIKRYSTSAKKTFSLLFEAEDLAATGEGGLLGVAVDPDFTANNFVYLYYTYRKNENLFNRVIRVSRQRDALKDTKIIIDGIPGSSNHNGGRIKFGPDRKLYITTGDAQKNELAQDLNSLAGKILRLNPDGTIPEDNPFSNSPIYSYGHRNPQGLAWDGQGKLWATEHGADHLDEVNIIGAGKNYGWPQIRGDQVKENLLTPIIHSGNDTWAPSGVALVGQRLFFVGLRGQALYSLNTNQTSPNYLELKQYYREEYGRLRDVVVDQNGFLYILTNNRDGRGSPKEDDDRLIRINPAILQ